MIKQIKTEKFDGVAVLVPNDAKTFITDYNFLIIDLCQSTQKMIHIPFGRIEILGKATELTEVQCAGIVPQMKDPGYPFEIEDYKITFENMMQSLECYSVNPYGCRPNDESMKYKRYSDGVSWHDHLVNEWQKTEQNTGTWLILKRL